MDVETREDEIGVSLDALRPTNGGAGPISNRAVAGRRDIPRSIAFVTSLRRSIDSAMIRLPSRSRSNRTNAPRDMGASGIESACSDNGAVASMRRRVAEFATPVIGPGAAFRRSSDDSITSLSLMARKAPRSSNPLIS